ncbi:FAD-dependent oxidoreductase (plasmid) [Candidatus Megaera polyxenophila]|nr:FAD-dependent oxidoreductase [Candidatus Megaera polyxenophila]
MTQQNVLHAIQDFTNALGIDNVTISREQCNKFENTTFATNQKVQGVLYPNSKEQVQQCINIAYQYNIKLYPLSTGLNIGLGGTVPVESNSFILNLGKMNQIIEFNESLGYITIESGVTQIQVVEFLKSKNSNFILSPTGSLPETSIIGNAVERGDTRGAIPQRAESICNLGVVLPSGEYMEIGFGRFANAKCSGISKYGVGPDYTGLFTQSNFGIVVKLTLWLAPKAVNCDIILFTMET